MSIPFSLRSLYKGVETAKIAGFALLGLLATERMVFGAKAAAIAIGWGELNWVALSDYEEARDLLTKKKWPEAAIILRSVLSKDPDYAPAAIELSEALFYSNRREEGLGVLSQVALREKGERRTAIIRRLGVLSRAFVSSTDFQSFQDGLNLMANHKYRNARERMDRVLREEPANVEILLRLGQSLVMDNDWDSAAERLKVAKRLNPYEPEVRLWLGRAMHQRGELGEAVDELRLARQELPGSELAPMWLAEALASLGQRDQALTVLEQDITQYPLHVQSLLLLATIRIAEPHPGRATLMDARTKLQLAQSRLEEYLAADSSRFEGELGLDLRKAQDEIKAELQRLFQRVEGRLDELNAEV
jgi:thioredoxin-like negative regulator of GroEL